ncbi:unnamed protein product [Ilex paraguariensis]|uniref:Uncharacterized protein n=1 Tax=Ilex paraguariensis TaxID=185542 RepID=A0ABC8QU95_9AQUA
MEKSGEPDLMKTKMEKFELRRRRENQTLKKREKEKKGNEPFPDNQTIDTPVGEVLASLYKAEKLIQRYQCSLLLLLYR